MSGLEILSLVIATLFFALALLAHTEIGSVTQTVLYLAAAALFVGAAFGFRANRLGHASGALKTAQTQIEHRYGPIKIDSLSVRQNTITYEKDGRICSTILIDRGNEHLIATVGAQCAAIPR